MKKYLTTFLGTLTVALSIISITASPAHAVWTYSTFSFPYTVDPSSNKSPTANAGPDKVITLPTNSVSVVGSGSDPDGTITSYKWTEVLGGAATIVSPSSATTTISGLAQGSYTFRLTVTDDGSPGLTGTDDMMVTVNPASAAATGSLTVTPTSCTIPLNASTCTSGSVNATWTTTNATSPNLYNGTAILSNAANQPSAFPVGSSVTYPSVTFYLRDGSTVLDSKSVTASCASGSSWVGSSCVANAVATVTLSAAPTSIYSGDASTLSVTASNFATVPSCTITDDHGGNLGSVTMSGGSGVWNGSKSSGALFVTTTYTANCGGTLSSPATVTVTRKPTFIEF
jgi:hypothetical protein